MKTGPKLRLALSAMLLLPAALQASDRLSIAELRSGKAQIAARHAQDRAACAALLANALDVCREQARSRERLALAELRLRDSGSAADAYKLRALHAEVIYAVARERCDDWRGNAREVCVKEARAVELKALADARLAPPAGPKQRDAGSDKAAPRRCGAITGDTRNGCVASAAEPVAAPR